MVMEFLPTDKPLLHNLNNKGPVEVFELYFDDRVKKIYNFTNSYAVEKAAVDWRILTKEELRYFLAIIMLIGQILPEWGKSSDVPFAAKQYRLTARSARLTPCRMLCYIPWIWS